MSDSVARHARISGVVQGVFFRASAQRQARQLGVVGWVRNMAVGRVELYAEGPRLAVDQFMAWAAQGPAHAVVRAIDQNAVEAEGTYDDFAVRR